jgi:hypothetical protein
MNPKTPWNTPLTIITRCFTTVRVLCTTSMPRANMAWKTASTELNRWKKMPTRDRKKELTEPDIEGDMVIVCSEEGCLWSMIITSVIVIGQLHKMWTLQRLQIRSSKGIQISMTSFKRTCNVYNKNLKPCYLSKKTTHREQVQINSSPTLTSSTAVLHSARSPLQPTSSQSHEPCPTPSTPQAGCQVSSPTSPAS